ncbi:MAG TPA: DUF5667 domain-containing protein [Patescibacteria group bacterium]
MNTLFIKRLITSFFILFLLIVLFNQTILAEDTFSLPNQSANPGSFVYKFKRGWEKLEEKFQFSNDSKISFYDKLTLKRLSELKYVSDHDLLSEFQTSSERFSYQAGVLSEYLNGISASKENKEKVIEEFSKYSDILASIRDKHSFRSSYWLYIQQNMDSLKELSLKLK